ncbi:hypothetical protein NKJ57_27290, partial [Mesorhizobium sp. M0077]
SMTTAKPLARYSAVEGALASGFATAELHHLSGRDLTCWRAPENQQPRCSRSTQFDTPAEMIVMGAYGNRSYVSDSSAA